MWQPQRRGTEKIELKSRVWWRTVPSSCFGGRCESSRLIGSVLNHLDWGLISLWSLSCWAYYRLSIVRSCRLYRTLWNSKRCREGRESERVRRFFLEARLTQGSQGTRTSFWSLSWSLCRHHHGTNLDFRAHRSSSLCVICCSVFQTAERLVLCTYSSIFLVELGRRCRHCCDPPQTLEQIIGRLRVMYHM